MKKVYVVTCSQLGWDNIVGVFDEDAVPYEVLQKHFPEDQYYYIDHRTVNTNLDDYEFTDDED
jgi:hypothetical protein